MARKSKTYRHVEQHAQAIEEARDSMNRATVQSVLQMGKELCTASERFQKLKLKNNGNGVFGAWIRDRLKLKRTTAHKWMSVYQVFGDCSYCEQFAVSALYLLSQPTAPKRAVNTAIAFAAEGNKVEPWRAKLFIEEAWDRDRQLPLPRQCEEDEEAPEPSIKRRQCRWEGFESLKSAWARAKPIERSFFERWKERRRFGANV